MPRFGLRVLFVSFALLGSIVAPPSPASAVTPLALGTVGTVTAGDTGTACPSGHTCYKATISACPGVAASKTGHFAVSPVPTGQTRGVVVIFSGGGGTSYWTKDATEPASVEKMAMVNDLYQTYGLRVVQVRWGASWYTASSGERAGPAKMGCRPATLLDHIRNAYYETISPAPAPAPGKCGFCVTGTSGGSAQATYPLSHYGFATDPSRLVHAVMPFSGPTHAAIAEGCLQTPGYTYGQPSDFDPPYGYLTSGQGPCALHDAAYATYWNADEVDSATTAESALANTRVYVIVGSLDTVMQNHADAYLAFVVGLAPESPKEIVSGMSHAPNAAGITSLKTALVSGLSPVVPSVPTITTFTPASGPVGTSVTVTGTAFGGATAVKFNGTAATAFSVISQTQLTATVPTGATTGTVSITTPGGTATSASSFTVTPPAPTVTSFTPTSGPVGASVTITGTTFTGATAVKFNATTATTFTVNSATQITATVPTGATTGKIAVTTASGTGTSASSFTVSAGPTISSFTPASGPAGTSVTINGSGLSGTTAVTFNGTAATSVQVLSGSQVRATVPSGATSGPIGLTTPTGTATSVSSFTVTTTGGSLTLTAKDAAATETDPGQTAKKCLVKVTLSATPSTQVTVTYSTAPNTATAPSDYTHQAGKVLTWPAGTTSLTKNAPVTLTADSGPTVEPVETFYVNLTSPSGATIGDAQAVCTITDDAGG